MYSCDSKYKIAAIAIIRKIHKWSDKWSSVFALMYDFIYHLEEVIDDIQQFGYSEIPMTPAEGSLEKVCTCSTVTTTHVDILLEIILENLASDICDHNHITTVKNAFVKDVATTYYCYAG